MIRAIEIRRQIEDGWPAKFEVMTEKELSSIIYGAMAAANRGVERYLKDKLGERQKFYLTQAGDHA